MHPIIAFFNPFLQKISLLARALEISKPIMYYKRLMAIQRGETEPTSSQFTFDADPTVVAQQLKGAIILSGGKRFIIIQAKGFLGEEIKRKEFQAAKAAPVGTISGSPYRGNRILPNITVQDEGLVMPQIINELTAEGEIKRIEGPDRIARALGIEQNGRYQLSIEDPYSKIIRIGEYPKTN